MALHTIAFHNTTDATDGTLPAVTDEVLASAGLGLLPKERNLLIAAMAGGQTLESASLFQPSMDISPVNIRPLNTFTGPLGVPWPTPAGALFHARSAAQLAAQEAVLASWQSSNSERVAVLAWLADRVDPVPEGESFLLGFSAKARAAAGATGWFREELAWSVPFLPVGRYAIVGMDCFSTGTAPLLRFAARLYLPGQLYRPGAPIMGESRTLPPAFLLDGSLGCWGWFEQRNPPQVEFLCSNATAGALTADVTGYLRVIRESSPNRGASQKVGWR